MLIDGLRPMKSLLAAKLRRRLCPPPDYTNAELVYNKSPRFAPDAARLLTSPFVLIDVGVNGGIHPRWNALGQSLEVHGFDPQDEVVRPLEGQGHSYYAMALGNEDGHRDIYVTTDTYTTSMYQHGESPYAVGAVKSAGMRKVPIRRLDSLMAEGLFTRADFIKVDTEGFEPEVLKGAQRLLQSTLAVEAECSFNSSWVMPKSHFVAVQEQLEGFTVYDIAFNRIPRATWPGGATLPRPATVNALFARDPRNEDEALRLAIIFELYGLRDSAYDLVHKHPMARLLVS